MRNSKNNDGFTLMELVVAMAVLFVLLSGGMITYANFDSGLEEGTVDIAAASLANKAFDYEMDFDETTDLEQARKEWTSITKHPDISVEVSIEGKCVTAVATHKKGYESAAERCRTWGN